MRPDDPMRGGARWCESHRRWECVHDRSRGRGQCHGAAVKGLDSCRMHAGSKDRVNFAKALALRPPAVGHWQPIRVHPAEALLDEVYHWAGLCAWLDRIVAGLQEGEMVWGLTRRRVTAGTEGAEEDATWEAGLNAWIAWQQRAHESKARVARLALESMAEDTMVRLAETQAARQASLFERGLARLELTEHQWELARRVYPELVAELVA